MTIVIDAFKIVSIVSGGVSPDSIVAILGFAVTGAIAIVTGSVWISYRIGSLENSIRDMRNDIAELKADARIIRTSQIQAMRNRPVERPPQNRRNREN